MMDLLRAWWVILCCFLVVLILGVPVFACFALLAWLVRL